MRLTWILPLVLFQSCQVLKESTSHEQTNGYYRVKTGDTKPEHVFLDFTGDTIAIYRLSNDPEQKNIPNAAPAQILTPGHGDQIRITKTSLDIDLTTILFKCRPRAGELPVQLNTNFNFAVYGGYRKDYTVLKNSLDPLQRTQAERRRWGWDIGLFAGMGATPINPWVTDQRVAAEYDGLAFQTGVAAYTGVNNLAAGLCLGFDYLSDSNQKYWIYHKKPWIGVSIGLALN